jgi:HD superfamily phosphohydrolase YqeK
MDEIRLIKDMENYFGKDTKRINHAKRVTQFVKQILMTEPGNPEVVIPAAIFHDIGIHEAERKFGSTSGFYQESEGPPIARKILEEYQIDEQTIGEICAIIGHHHSPGKINTLNFKIVYDADWLVNIPDEFGIQDKERLKEVISKIFLTGTGKDLAEKIFVGGDPT